MLRIAFAELIKAINQRVRTGCALNKSGVPLVSAQLCSWDTLPCQVGRQNRRWVQSGWAARVLLVVPVDVAGEVIEPAPIGVKDDSRFTSIRLDRLTTVHMKDTATYGLSGVLSSQYHVWLIAKYPVARSSCHLHSREWRAHTLEDMSLFVSSLQSRQRAGSLVGR